MSAKKKTPAYLFHKPSGQARVRIDGKDHYLGDYDSPKSREVYDALITAWLRKEDYSRVRLTIDELVLAYLDFARGYYVKEGKPTTEICEIKSSLKPLVELFGTLRVREFSPLKLKAVRDVMVSNGWARKTVNAKIGRVRRMFKWGVENELAPVDVFTSLTTVIGLRRGKTKAKDFPPVFPVDDAVVDATLPHLNAVVADMIRLQRLTGMRPAEVCLLRPCDLDRTEDQWCYRPSSHKTEHYGRERLVFIGPQGQDVLRKYLLRPADSFCFSPAESEKLRREMLHEARKTPLSCGNRPGTNRQVIPQKTVGDCYDHNSYRIAIHRACERAFPPPADLDTKLVAQWRREHRWNPNQLRHSFATKVRKQFGLEAAQVLLGHASAEVTQVYAERDTEKARSVAGVVG